MEQATFPRTQDNTSNKKLFGLEILFRAVGNTDTWKQKLTSEAARRNKIRKKTLATRQQILHAQWKAAKSTKKFRKMRQNQW